MDWLVDRHDTGSMDRALVGLTEHLRRHAASDVGVETAVAPVRDVLEDSWADADARLLWLSLDWRAAKPQVAVAELPGPPEPEVTGLEPGTALRTGTVASLTRTQPRLLAETTLDLDRHIRETFDEGPPPMSSVPADPRRDGAAAVAVALSAAAEAHPGASAAQLAALAGAVLADNAAADAPPTSGAEAAALLAQAHGALGSEVEVLAADDESIDVVISRCPFAPGVADNDALCQVTTGLAGRLAARVNGVASVVLPESIAAGDPACYLHMRLGSASEDVRGETHRWPPVVGTVSRGAPHLELSVNLPSETGSVPVVRRLAAQALRSFGVTEPDVGDVQVAIGEACANVIKHAIDSDTYEVQVQLTAERCTITVIDQGRGFDATAIPENPDPHSEGGRGLTLIRALTDNVAFRNEPQAGTVVHMTKHLAHDDTHPLWRDPPTVG